MISIEAYLFSSNFNNSSKQLNLPTAVTVRPCMSSSRFHDLLKPTRCITLIFLMIIKFSSGDIETNPGPTFSIKSVQESCHQNKTNMMLVYGLYNI